MYATQRVTLVNYMEASPGTAITIRLTENVSAVCILGEGCKGELHTRFTAPGKVVNLQTLSPILLS